MFLASVVRVRFVITHTAYFAVISIQKRPTNNEDVVFDGLDYETVVNFQMTDSYNAFISGES